jgi:uncharacterized protein (TIGR03032 family)
MTPELRLLLACSSVQPDQATEAIIRELLVDGVDWTLLAATAVAHRLTALVGHTLTRVASDLVPDDILIALRVSGNRIREKNLALFGELATILDALAQKGIEAIPLIGPVLCLQIYGDLGLREFQDLDFLVRDVDMAQTMSILRTLGYERREQLTEVQHERIRRLQGREVTFNKCSNLCVKLHLNLTPLTMALYIDCAGLWQRAIPAASNGRVVKTLAPEDVLLFLAIRGGYQLWWRINWVCDLAAFIKAHPCLDWGAIFERARAYGCRRMVLVALSLARQCFNVAVPDLTTSTERADRTIEPVIRRIFHGWLADSTVGPPNNEKVSMDRLRLHDGAWRRARYVARTWVLPRPRYIARVALPRGMGGLYVPMWLGHELIGLSLSRAYQKLIRSGKTVTKNRVAEVLLKLPMILVSSLARRRLEQREPAPRTLNPPDDICEVPILPPRQLRSVSETNSETQNSCQLTVSPQFSTWLVANALSIAISSHQSNKLFLVGLNQFTEQISISEHSLYWPTGMVHHGQQLTIATGLNITVFRDAAGDSRDASDHDVVFAPRFSYYTGWLDVHDLALDARGKLVFVNTQFSCLATTSATHNFRPIWRPSFVSHLAAEDRCHLNGLALRDGSPAYVTAFSETDFARGWRQRPAASGVVIDVVTNEIVCRGLTNPHSPRLNEGTLWVLNSGTGEIGIVDLKIGRFVPVCFCPGFLRGLAFMGRYAVVGASKVRPNRGSVGLALLERLETDKVAACCGVYIIDTLTGSVVHALTFEGATKEFYDIVLLPGVKCPTASLSGRDAIIAIEM